MNKPVKPNITIPESFAKNGIKTDFDSDLITEGFDSLKPDVLAGDNLNKFIDDTYKGLNYGIAAGDAINLIQEGETLTVQNGQLVSGSTGGGLEVCDIGMALYVDETKGLRRYLNGQIVDINTNTQAFLNRLKEITTLHPSLLCTENEWQTAKTNSAFGQVGKFVFNYSGEDIVSVRLPRVVNVQGLFDLQNLGLTVNAGLPNITGDFSLTGAAGSYGKQNGAFYLKSKDTGYQHGSSGSNANPNVGFDASRSNPIYGNYDTVQPEAIQYPYFIQIATGSETEANIVNTLENVNGFTLLESKYSDKPLYNESWLLSNGQWNAKAVYPTVYEGLQVEYNSEIEAGTTVTLPSGVSYTKRGLSVKLSTEEYTDYDFVLNTANETFRLPLLDGSEDLPSNRYTDLELLSSGSLYTAPANGIVSFNKVAGAADKYANIYVRFSDQSASYATGVSATSGGQNLIINAFVKKGANYVVNYNATGATNYFRFTYAQGNGSLYFYVGDLDQNHGIVNMGRIGEQLANKQDKCVHIIDTYVNGTSWYRIWSDGWCEQGGIVSLTNNQTLTVNLLKSYTNSTYSILQSPLTTNYTDVWGYGTKIVSLTNSSFKIYINSSTSGKVCWQASGYIN